jgi:hypothetical protein
MGAINYPLINGQYFDYTHIETKFNGSIFIAYKSISHNKKLEPTAVYGADPMPLGFTRGTAEFEGSVEMYLAQYKLLIAKLGQGYMEKSFDIVINYAATGMPTSTDELLGCRIKGEDNSHSQGTDPLMTKFDLAILRIKTNGLDVVSTPLTGAGIDV